MFRFVCVCLYHSLRLSLKLVEYVIGEDGHHRIKSDNTGNDVDIILRCKCSSKRPRSGETERSVHIIFPCHRSEKEDESDESAGSHGVVLPSCEKCELYHKLNHISKALDIPEKGTGVRDVSLRHTDTATTDRLHSTNDVGNFYFTKVLSSVAPRQGWTFHDKPATCLDKTTSNVTANIPDTVRKPTEAAARCTDDTANCADVTRDLHQALTFEKELNARLTEYINTLTLDIIQEAPLLLQRK